MTRLRKMMLDELERRNYSQNTRRIYLYAVTEFARHFHRSPDQLGLDHIRAYQAHLFRERKLKANSVCVHVEALRFLFVHVLKRRWTVDELPYPKRPQNAAPRPQSPGSSATDQLRNHPTRSRHSHDSVRNRNEAC